MTILIFSAWYLIGFVMLVHDWRKYLDLTLPALAVISFCAVGGPIAGLGVWLITWLESAPDRVILKRYKDGE